MNIRRTAVIMLAILATLIGLSAPDAVAVTVGSRFDPADFTAIGTVNMTNGTINFNTTTLAVTGPVTATGVTSNTTGGQTVAVFCFNSVSITGTATITVTGTRPIAILSKGTFTLGRPLNVVGSNGSGNTGGTGIGGGSNGGNRSTAGSGTGGGGAASNEAGAGASYGGLGGRGATSNTAVGATYGSTDMASLFAGGSGGGGGHRGSDGGGGGAGGGAVELVAATTLTINAGGQVSVVAGNGATDNQAGGGGGSGGSILLAAPTVVNNGSLLARGGNGGNATTASREGGGGGGGGRIAIFANTLTTGITDVTGGAAGSATTPGVAGSSGTLYTTIYSAPPTVTSINRLNTDPTNALSVGFRIIFSASVTNVQTSDLQVTTTGGISGASVTGLSGSGTTYDVTVNTGTGEGTIRLDVLDFDTIIDVSSQPLGGVGLRNADFTTGQVYTIDRTAPTISISSPSTSTTRNGPVTYTITYIGANAVTLANGNVTLNTTGTATGTVAVTGTGTATRTVTISSISGNGTLGISIAAGTATDSAGNAAAVAGPSTTFNVDNTPPTLSISAPSVSVTGTGPVTYTITYTGADAITLNTGNITLNRTGTATGAYSITGTGTATRTVTISSITGSGTIGISVSAGSASDLAGNTASAAGPSSTFTVDNTAVSVSIGSPSSTITRNGPVTYTVTYTNAASITLSNSNITLNATGTAAATTIGVSGSGNTRTVTISGISGDGTLGISIAAGTATTSIGNPAPAAGPSTTFTVDNTGPTITIDNPNPSSACIGDDTVTFGVKYINAQPNILNPSFIVLNTTGTATASVEIVGTADTNHNVKLKNMSGVGTISITILPGSGFDAAGNPAQGAGPSAAVTIDRVAPTVTIGPPSTTITNGGPVTYTVTYTDASVINLTPSDITLSKTGTANGVVSVAGSGNTTRTVTISSTSGDGTLGFTIAAGTADDNTCNVALPSAASQTFTVDNTPPTVSISAPSTTLTAGGPVTYTLTFSGASAVNLTPSDITLNSSGTATGAVSISGSGTSTRTVTIDNITGDGSLGISVASGAAVDVATNLSGAAGPSATFVVDNTAPTLSIGAPSVTLTNSGPVTFTVTYSGADSILLAPGMVTLNTTGTATGTVNVTGSGTGSRTVEILGISGDGTIGISIASGSATDNAGNLSAVAGPSAVFTVDNTGPTIAIGAPSVSATQAGPVSYTITYTDATVISLADTDIIVTSTGSAMGTSTVSGSGLTTRTVTFSGVSGDGTLGFTIAGGTAVDAAGNAALAAGPSPTFTVDNTPPGISIGAPSVSITNAGPVSYTITYADASSISLSPGDITLNAGGSANGLIAVTGSGTTNRTVTISGITGDGTLSISIGANTAVDAAGNSALAAGPSATFDVDNTAPTVLIGAPSASVTSTGPVTFTVTYSGADTVTLAPGNISLNATGSATGVVSVSGVGSGLRIVTISSITGNGTLGINVAANTAADLAGNLAGPAGPSATFTVNNALPSVSIGAPSLSTTRSGPVSYPLTFANTANVTLTAGQVVLNTTGTATGTVSLSGSGNAARTVTINSISGDGTLSISIPAGAGNDGGGNSTPAAGPSAPVDVDNTAPGVAISASSVTATRNGPVTYTVTYNGADDVSLANGHVTLNATGSATGTVNVSGTGHITRTITISGISGDGTLGISIAGATASDVAGNTAAAAGPSGTFTVDNTGPTLGIGSPSIAITRVGPADFVATYTDASSITLTPVNVALLSTGTATGVVTVTGVGTASRTISLINLAGDGTVAIAIAAGTAVDALGNTAGAAGPSATVIVDNTAPVITMLGVNPVTTEFSVPYVDAGATAIDNVDGNLTSKIDVTSNVNVWAAGSYTVAYNVSDTAGNAATTKVRTVSIERTEEDNVVLEFLGRTICRPGICVTINGNVLFTPAGSFHLIIDRPDLDMIPAGLFNSMLPGTWFDVRPYSARANNLGFIKLEYGAAIAGRGINDDNLFVYVIDGITGAVEILDDNLTINTAEKTIRTPIKKLGIYAVGYFVEAGPNVGEGDPDQDLLTDDEENSLGTNPNNPDTDGDGVMDGIEDDLGTDPLNPLDFPELPTASRLGILLMTFGFAAYGVIALGLTHARNRRRPRNEQ